jgi:hypothetical protein
VLAVAGFFPIVMGLIQGQDAVLLLLLVVLATVAAAQQRFIVGGAILALGLFKFHLIIPLAMIVAAKRPRILLGFLPVAAGLVVMSILIVGFHGCFEYVKFILNLEHSGAGGAISAYEMPNLHGLISDVAGNYARNIWSTLLTIAGSVAVVALAVAFVRKETMTIQDAFGVATIAALLIGYHTMPYDLSLAFPVALFLFTNAAIGRTGLFLLFLLFLTPLYVFLGLHLDRLGWLALPLLLLFWRLGRTAAKEPALAT